MHRAMRLRLYRSITRRRNGRDRTGDTVDIILVRIVHEGPFFVSLRDTRIARCWRPVSRHSAVGKWSSESPEFLLEGMVVKRLRRYAPAERSAF